ncbi:MAG: hypothetical protein PHV06_02670 [bacterium]|nr:hypothetical protein [bacterium]
MIKKYNSIKILFSIFIIIVIINVIQILLLNKLEEINIKLNYYNIYILLMIAFLNKMIFNEEIKDEMTRASFSYLMFFSYLILNYKFEYFPNYVLIIYNLFLVMFFQNLLLLMYFIKNKEKIIKINLFSISFISIFIFNILYMLDIIIKILNTK